MKCVVEWFEEEIGKLKEVEVVFYFEDVKKILIEKLFFGIKNEDKSGKLVFSDFKFFFIVKEDLV